MKKSIILLSSLFLTIIMQAQDRTQPKPGPAPKININKPETFSLQNGLKVLVVDPVKSGVRFKGVEAIPFSCRRKIYSANLC